MGAFLLLSADVRIGVDEGARFQLIEVQIGMTLPRFAIEVCRQRLTPAHLALAAGTAEPYAPQRALAAGFLDEIVPAASLAATVRAQATRLKNLHAEAFAATRLRLREHNLDALRHAIRDDIAEWNARGFGPA
jgi:enoyl-CoA hydratase